MFVKDIPNDKNGPKSEQIIVKEDADLPKCNRKLRYRAASDRFTQQLTNKQIQNLRQFYLIFLIRKQSSLI
jgi:hypothetical protein